MSIGICDDEIQHAKTSSSEYLKAAVRVSMAFARKRCTTSFISLHNIPIAGGGPCIPDISDIRETCFSSNHFSGCRRCLSSSAALQTFSDFILMGQFKRRKFLRGRRSEPCRAVYGFTMRNYQMDRTIYAGGFAVWVIRWTRPATPLKISAKENMSELRNLVT